MKSLQELHEEGDKSIWEWYGKQDVIAHGAKGQRFVLYEEVKDFIRQEREKAWKAGMLEGVERAEKVLPEIYEVEDPDFYHPDIETANAWKKGSNECRDIAINNLNLLRDELKK